MLFRAKKALLLFANFLLRHLESNLRLKYCFRNERSIQSQRNGFPGCSLKQFLERNLVVAGSLVSFITRTIF